jgi:hypothetical protein
VILTLALLWVALSLPLSLLIGKAIRSADEREARHRH